MPGDARRFLQPPSKPGSEVGPVICLSSTYAEWLLEHRVSLAYTSYQTGRLIVAGVGPDGRPAFNEQDYSRAMGLCYDDGTLYVASLFQIWRLKNMLLPGEYANRAHDRVFVPRQAHTTGFVDAHELAVDKDGQILFVNSRYSCVATIDDTFSFRSIWKPPFISALEPEDRCHLNGFALHDGELSYVTTLGVSDRANGWRDEPAGGAVIRVSDGEIIADRLSMPHSPRLYEQALWVLESGRGYIVRIDLTNGTRTDLVFCPGFLRGMTIHEGFAIVALSIPRSGSLPLTQLEEELTDRGLDPWCGLALVDLHQGAIVEFIRYESEITELFDIAVIPDVRNPITIGPATEELLSAVRPRPDPASPSR